MSDTAPSVVSATTNTKSQKWANEQNWIKDVLSKSGTELVHLTANKSLKITKKVIRENEQDSQNKTMVYYQSTPLIIKSEQPSQAQLCGSLRATPSTEHHQPLHMQNPSPILNGYNLSSVALSMQQQQMSQITNTSINSHHHQQQQQQQHQQQHQQQQQHQTQPPYLTSIKTELLPPGITLYATTQPATLTSTTQHVTSSSQNSNNNASMQPTSTTGGAAVANGRKTNPNKPQFKCEQCGMTFGSKSAHTSHTKSHIKNGETGLLNLNSSAVASSTTQNGLELNEAGLPMGIPKTPQIKPNANAATNGGDPYQCNVCQKTFAVPARLIRHYRTHTGERPFECEFCHKLFSVKENLQVHRRIHTKERPYKCDVCGRAFEHSGKLHRHMRIHTGERPHKCSVCEKTFIQSGQLVIHMRTHTGEKPYKCPVEGCGKGFTCSKQLKVHSRTHTGEKPYHCDICFRDFGYNHVLKLHRVQHYGSKCYKCTICDETFKSKKEMEAHIKGHANEMPDDEEEAAAAANNNGANTTTNATTTSSSSPSTVSALSGTETISGPNSPQSPSSSVGTIASSTTKTTTKQRKPKQEKSRSTSVSGPLSPCSPASPSSSMSPSSSYASGSRLSAASPTCSVASPTMSLSMETDHHSRDSGVASGSIPTSHNTRHLAATTLMDMGLHGSFPTAEEMPTDLSVTQQTHHHHMEQHSQQQQQHQQQHMTYHYQNSSQSPQQSQQYQYLNNSQMSPVHQQQQQHQDIDIKFEQHQQPSHQAQAPFETPTINPALLEAATIASRREDDVQQAAIQIMQLHRSQRKPNGQTSMASNGHSPIYSELQKIPANIHQTLITPLNRAVTTTGHQHPLVMDQYDESQEANDLIEQYKRGEMTRHGLTKGYAPVPKFETSLPNNEILLRQVEAAIAPLRSSTESPDRSSSPDCDAIVLMSDRDVMTLPLRKRKLYMNDMVDVAGEMEPINTSKDVGQKVMRHSSVIQFAKAS